MRRIGVVLERALFAALAAVLAAATAKAGPPEDAWITTQVKMKLLTARTIDPFDIDVDTNASDVTLHGRVETLDLKQTAELLAKGIEGVRGVRNLLVVQPEGEPDRAPVSDEELRTHVEEALARDTALATSRVAVASVESGIVTLSGHAATLAAHQRALEVARAVDGVRSVTSGIHSPVRLDDRELARDDAAAASDAAADTRITARAKALLRAEPRISPAAVHVDTRAGVLTLFGTVGSEDEKALAQRAVARVHGVRSVENELQVVMEEGSARRDEAPDAAMALELARAPRGADSIGNGFNTERMVRP